MSEMSEYLQSYLVPFLARRGVSDEFLKSTVQVIESQGNSLLQNWDDTAFRRTVLLLGSEEGPFYEPAGRADVKCFVVAAIRNSPVETLQSENYAGTGLSQALTNEDVKAITGNAIRYFNTLDFAKLCKAAKEEADSDLYRGISKRYPIAWEEMSKLANSSGKEVDYPALPIIAQYRFAVPPLASNANKTEVIDGRMVRSCYDGYTAQMDPVLLGQLERIAAEPGGAFVVDSFKTASRNVERLFQIMEFLFTRGCAFATANYYLENGHVERRIKPLRAAHTTLEMSRNLSQISGLGRKHTRVLKQLGK